MSNSVTDPLVDKLRIVLHFSTRRKRYIVDRRNLKAKIARRLKLPASGIDLEFLNWETKQWEEVHERDLIDRAEIRVKGFTLNEENSLSDSDLASSDGELCFLLRNKLKKGEELTPYEVKFLCHILWFMEPKVDEVLASAKENNIFEVHDKAVQAGEEFSAAKENSSYMDAEDNLGVSLDIMNESSLSAVEVNHKADDLGTSETVQLRSRKKSMNDTLNGQQLSLKSSTPKPSVALNKNEANKERVLQRKKEKSFMAENIENEAAGSDALKTQKRSGKASTEKMNSIEENSSFLDAEENFDISLDAVNKSGSSIGEVDGVVTPRIGPKKQFAHMKEDAPKMNENVDKESLLQSKEEKDYTRRSKGKSTERDAGENRKRKIETSAGKRNSKFVEEDSTDSDSTKNHGKTEGKSRNIKVSATTHSRFSEGSRTPKETVDKKNLRKKQRKSYTFETEDESSACDSSSTSEKKKRKSTASADKRNSKKSRTSQSKSDGGDENDIQAMMKSEMSRNPEPNPEIIRDLMNKSFEWRQQYIMIKNPRVKQILKEYPALTLTNEVIKEFNRIKPDVDFERFMENILNYQDVVIKNIPVASKVALAFLHQNDLIRDMMKSDSYNENVRNLVNDNKPAIVLLLLSVYFKEDVRSFISFGAPRRDVYPIVKCNKNIKDIFDEDTTFTVQVENTKLCTAATFEQAFYAYLGSFYIFNIQFPKYLIKTISLVESLFIGVEPETVFGEVEAVKKFLISKKVEF